MMGNPFGYAGEWPNHIDDRRVRVAVDRAHRYRAALMRLYLRRMWHFAVSLFVHRAAGSNTGAWQA